MSYSDIIGTTGVAIILIAYCLSTARMMSAHSSIFFLMNAIGAALTCYASWLIDYIPFMVLEGVWTIVSLYGLMRVGKRGAS